MQHIDTMVKAIFSKNKTEITKFAFCATTNAELAGI